MRTVAVAALLLALVTSATMYAAGNAAAGKDVFTKRCVTCHGADGNGNAAVAKMMKVTIPELSSKEVQSRSDAEIGKVITEGKDKMKPVAGLSATEVTNLVAFIRGLAKK
jgi:mono/diheme cytochrome c family protein